MTYKKPEIVTYTDEDLKAMALACGSVCCSAGGSRD